MMGLTDQPTGVVIPHSCQHCDSFVVYLYDDHGESRTEKPTWLRPNKSQNLLAEKIFGLESQGPELEEQRSRFYRITHGCSFFDVDLQDLGRYSSDGCTLSDRLLRCLTKEDEMPRSFAIGVQGLTAYSLELGVLDLETLRWETLLADESDLHTDNVYTMLAFQDDSSGSVLDNYPLNPEPGSSRAMKETKKWLLECSKYHHFCQAPTTEFMPTRLVQIVRRGDNILCKLQQTLPGVKEPYASLSYCWGGDQIFKTTLNKIPQYEEEIKLENLPQTLQDAIFVTEQLGLNYIWIDALCIIQDSNEDKSYEIGQMVKVYGNATVTIAASRAKAVWDGFLHERLPLGFEEPHLVFSLPYQLSDGQQGHIVLIPLTFEGKEPLDSRGWTFQERVLSYRVLDFGSFRAQWNCRTYSGPVFSDGWSRRALDRAYDSSGLDSQLVSDLIRGKYSTQEMLRFWMKVTEGFTTRGLSFFADKLPAIAGLAECFGELMQDEYLAGLWRLGLPASLLWSNVPSMLKSRPLEYCAPSWSWASSLGRVHFNALYTYPDPELRFEVEVQSCQVEVADKRAGYGAVKSGELTLKAHMRLAKWVRESIYGSTDVLLAVDAGIAEHPQALDLGFSKGRSTLIAMVSDALESDFMENPASLVDVCLVLFGSRVLSEGSGLYPSFFGLVLRAASEGKYSRVGLFEKTLPSRDFVRYMEWFHQGGKEIFIIV